MNADWPPGERGLPIFGRFFDIRQDPLGTLLDLHRRHGDVAYMRIGPQDVVQLADPSDIHGVLVTHASRFRKSRMLERAQVLLGQGLLTAEGSHHTRQRKLIQPAFYHDRLRSYADVMASESQRAISAWRSGEQRDLAREFMSLTLAIVSRCLFSAEVSNAASEVARAMTVILEMFDFMLLPGSRHLERLPLLPVARRSRVARQQLDRIVRNIIRRRAGTGESGEDLLGLLLSARDEDGSPMSEQQVRDEVLTLFLAGHETTANALCWTFYLLAKHPEVESRLHRELEEVLAGRPAAFDDFERLDLTRRILAEALRLYPPAWALGRRALEPYTVRRHRLPAGTIFVLSPYVTHRHPEYWPEPECFDPDRFLPSASAGRPRFAYFPFGGGPRACIGERFAWMEGVLVVAAIASRWRIRLTDQATVEPRAVITLRPRNGLQAQLVSRTNSLRF